MAIQTVGVIGVGVIGASWTGLFLSKGLKVIVADPAKDAEQHLKEYLQTIWPTLEELGMSPGASIDNCQFVGASLKDFGADLDFVQENGPERPDLKTKIVAEIENALRPEVVLASSSSGLPSSKFIEGCKNPERVMIGHPFNPPHLMPLVEVVPHSKTSQGAIDQAFDFYNAMGKRPVLIKQEVPGFAANRLQLALCNEAFSLVARGIISAEDVDTLVTTSLGPRWAMTGPFMSNVLGGGAGGFRHLVEHIGASSQVWVDDMKLHAFDNSPESINQVATSVEKMMEHHSVEQVMKVRDRLTVSLLKQKQDAEGL